MDIKDILAVEKEVERFVEKLKAAKDKQRTDPHFFYGCKESGALKRSALDLKVELTRITR